MKNGYSAYPSPTKSKENLSLKRTLSALDYERCLKMRELEIKRRQFIYEHRKTASRHSGYKRPNSREFRHAQIEEKKEKERQSTLALQNRSTDFIQELKVKPLSTLIKMEQKRDLLECEPSKPESNETQTLNSKVIALYQKGFSGVLRKDRQKIVNPFVQSVNTILENLKVSEEGGGSKMSNFTKKILDKFAGLNVGPTEPTKEDIKNSPGDVSSSLSVTPRDEEVVGANGMNLSEQNINKEADEYLKTARRSSKGLQLWAKVRKEQDSIEYLNKREQFLKANLNTEQRSKRQNKQMLSPDISKPKASRPDNLPLSSPICLDLSKSIKTLGDSPTRMKPTSNGGALSGTMSNQSVSPRSSMKSQVSRTPSPNKKPAGHANTHSNNKQTNRIGAASGVSKQYIPQPFPMLSVEDYSGKSKPQTFIVVHGEDDENAFQPPIHWDQSHRYSASDIHVDIKHLTKSDSDDPEEIKNTEKCSSPEDNAHDDPGVKSYDAFCSPDKNETASNTSESFINREELQPSALSLYTGSEMTSITRSQSRSGNKRSRRLSVQTSGALRALASVLNEGTKQAEKQEADSYTEMVHALAGVANGVEEQARRLENVRRAGPRLVGKNMAGSNSQGNRMQMRRGSMASPEKKNPAFVTNEVYKFLERRTSSKTMTRRPTLSKLELRLLSQVPGEDASGRRHSISNPNESRKGSVEMVPNTLSAGGPHGGFTSDMTTHLLEVVDRPKSSRRHSTGGLSEGVSTRPQSTSQLSNISENESLPSVNKTVRSYSWAPDVSETTDWHVLAMELLARNRTGLTKFRTVSHMLQWLGEEYRRQTESMMYEELQYCTYLRLTPHQVPDALKNVNVGDVFLTED